MKQIAARAGLSVPTVGNVLGRASHRYSKETRDKVIQVAKELGYRPNSSAKAMRSGRFGCASLVVSRNRRLSDLPQMLIEGLDDELVQHSMHLMIARLPDEDFSKTDFVPKVLSESMADGMIINYTHSIPREMQDLICDHQVPAVWINARLRGDCTYPDDHNGARVAVEHLVAHGHRRIAYVHFISLPGDHPRVRFEDYLTTEHYSVADRRAGYREAVRAAGLPAIELGADAFVPGHDFIPQVTQLLARPDRPTAVLTYRFEEAEAVVIAAAQLGLSVPRDVSLVTFETEPWRAMAGRKVTTLLVPAPQEGREAVRMLLRKIQEPTAVLPPVPVPFTFVPGETIAPPGP
jgi:LacI family transcriptional regulator